MNGKSGQRNIRTIIKRRFRLTLALFPGTAGLCVFIALMSPHSFSATGFNYVIGLFAVAVGILLAYSIAMFADEVMEKPEEKKQ